MFVESVIEITKYDYKKLLAGSYSDIYSYVLERSNNSPYPACGYGFYSPRILQKEGKYYISWQHFDSCD